MLCKCISSSLFSRVENAKHLSSLPGFYWLDSGRSALMVFLKCIKKEQGPNRVLIPSFTCCVVYDAVVSAGCDPVVYQASAVNPLGSIDAISLCITDEILCVITQSVFGRSSFNLASEIRALFPDIIIIDDRAHGHQGILDRTKHPYDAYFYSFDQSKIFSCYRGGLLVTDYKIDTRLIQASNYLEDLRDLIFFVFAYLLLVVLSTRWSLLIYKVSIRLFRIRPSMSSTEKKLDGLSSSPKGLSSLKLSFILPQLKNASELYERQFNYCRVNHLDTSPLEVICTRLVTDKLYPKIAISNNFWFSGPFYPATEATLQSKSINVNQDPSHAFVNVILSRRIIND